MTSGAGHVISRARPRSRAASPGLQLAVFGLRLFVFVLLASLVAQMALPALHAWRTGVVDGIVLAVASGHPGTPGPVVSGPVLSRTTPAPPAHDPARCPVCQLLHNAGRVAPVPSAFALPLASVESALAAVTSRATGRAAGGDHAPRAPPA